MLKTVTKQDSIFTEQFKKVFLDTLQCGSHSHKILSS